MNVISHRLVQVSHPETLDRRTRELRPCPDIGAQKLHHQQGDNQPPGEEDAPDVKRWFLIGEGRKYSPQRSDIGHSLGNIRGAVCRRRRAYSETSADRADFNSALSQYQHHANTSSSMDE